MQGLSFGTAVVVECVTVTAVRSETCLDLLSHVGWACLVV